MGFNRTQIQKLGMKRTEGTIFLSTKLFGKKEVVKSVSFEQGQTKNPAGKKTRQKGTEDS